MENINIHLADADISPKLFSGPIVFPNPGPTLASEVAAADREVTKSNSVVDNNKVITMKLSIKTKKNPITDVITSFSSFL